MSKKLNPHSITDLMLKADASDKQIIARLRKLKTHPCVIEECLGERDRRDALEVRRQRKKARKRTIGNKGQPMRRIIHTEVWPKDDDLLVVNHWVDQRELVLHATKGWREYRVPA